jgi:putative addiction module component (TIGR02574 family)
MTLEEIKSSLEALGPAERGEVLAFLLRRRLLEDPSYRAEDSRQPLGLSAEQRAELDQRLDDLEANPQDSLPWEKVRARIMAEL